MSVLEILGAILIGPLKLLFEVIFSISYRAINHPGAAVIILSLAMNVLVLPLYKRADAIQIQSRDTENKLKDVVAHIKKTFSGDERMMILQTYYRQNNYSPLSVLSGSVSLLLEIPFFMAAYQFLSGVSAFQGAAFGPISDLSAPDGLLTIGGMTINLLPIIMTLVNVISSSLYLKGFPLKTKIQLYGMALFFLVFLYNSPAALVFYWTLNNTFSLAKTLYYRFKHSKSVLNVLLGVAGVGLMILSHWVSGFWKPVLMVCIGIAMQLPWLLPLLQKKLPQPKKQAQPVAPNTKLFVLGAIFLTVLIGLLIPSAYIAASPQEYIDTSYFYNPIWYVINTLCLSAGTFLVWFGVFYWLADPKFKVIFSRLVWILSGVMLVNYMFFGTNLGVLSPDLIYTDGFGFARKEHLLNIAVVLGLAAVLYFLVRKFSRQLPAVLLIGIIALFSMGMINSVQITKTAAETKARLSTTGGGMPSFSLSQTGQNVVVIMLDRAIGPFVPYLMEENPTLLEQFDGFTYYSNTMAYGGFTNFAAPALYGGYDYTPVNMNLRSDELLVEKHNEALKVMPTLFAEAGYDTTLIDPSYANYQWIPDVSIFDDIEGVTAYCADGRFNDLESRVQVISSRKRNFFLFSVMKTLPVSVQAPIYNSGVYHAMQTSTDEADTSGVLPAFMNAYNVMTNMTTMTEITAEEENTFMFLRSNITHEATILQEPTFTPSSTVDNSAYYSEEGKTITAGDSTYLLNREYSISHYHINMAALIQLGNWFDYLRENGVYDNTRIIIVSDHGRDLGVFDDASAGIRDTEFYMAMLMVKDFNATGFTTSEAFMTNADVPTLAMEGLIENPVNPFTGNEINSDFKIENERQYAIVSTDWDVTKNNGYQFIESEWASVSEDVRNNENWEFYTEPAVLPPDTE